MFTKAIVRTPGRSVINGVTTAGLGKPDYCKALEQHRDYIKALRLCGLDVIVMPPDEAYPDSTFVEDCAVLTEKFTIIGNLGIKSRKGEESSIAKILREYYSNITQITEPGTLEGGDVLRVGDHFYIGITRRTNVEGAERLISVLSELGYTGSTVHVTRSLHLKTGVACLDSNEIVLAGEFIGNQVFGDFKSIIIDDDESYAANCVRINKHVLMPAGYPKAMRKVEAAGYSVVEVDVSEFRKIDGGISCLSLRF